MPPELRYTFHYIPLAYFSSLDPAADYTPPEFERDGFIHCTDGAENMLKTANLHYASDPRDFLALYLDKTRIKSPVRYEDAAQIYPHIYGPLNRDAIVRAIPAPRDADGTFLLMPEIEE